MEYIFNREDVIDFLEASNHRFEAMKEGEEDAVYQSIVVGIAIQEQIIRMLKAVKK